MAGICVPAAVLTWGWRRPSLGVDPRPPEPVTEPTPEETRRTPDRPCLNCGDTTPGNFCRNCGQRKVEVRVSLRRMLLEALDDQFSLNSALPRTLQALIFKPGHLTREYMEGRIARYIPPFRLYLISSVIFFLILSFRLGGPNGLKVQMTSDSTEVVRDSAGQPRNWVGNPTAHTGSVGLDSLIVTRLRRLGEMPPKEAVRRVGSDFLEYVPQTMFLLLPLFAGILKLLYIRRRRLYVEHFVFALHLHAFVFLTFAAQVVIDLPVVEALAALWTAVYAYLAMHRVYGQGWFRTAVKYVLLGFTYSVVMSLAPTLTFIIVLLLM